MCAAPHYNSSVSPQFDVVGVGLNATDTLLVVPHFPAYAGKVPFERGDCQSRRPGGERHGGVRAAGAARQVHRRRGRRRARAHPDGEPARHRASTWTTCRVRRDCPIRSAYIIIDQSTGERTVLWARADCLRIDPGRDHAGPDRLRARCCISTGTIRRQWRTRRESRAAHGIPVTVDVDTIYHGFDQVLPNVDYLVASSEFPAQWTDERDPLRALETIQNEYGMRVAAMTLGAHGALALDGWRASLFAGICGELRGYHRRGRRVSWGVLLCCFARHAAARRTGFLQCDGGAQLHGPGGARRYSAALEEVRATIERAPRRAHPICRRAFGRAGRPSTLNVPAQRYTAAATPGRSVTMC